MVKMAYENLIWWNSFELFSEVLKYETAHDTNVTYIS